MISAKQEQTTRNLRLTQTVKHPASALENGWFEDPKFCQGFFDRCDDLAFVLSPATFELTHRAVEIAERNGDPHLIHRSYGVLSHGYIIRGDLFWAGKILRDARRRVLACCPRCRAEHLRREGDVLGEERKIGESLTAFDHALEEGGARLDADSRAKILYLRSISHYHDGARRRSISDLGTALADLSLTSPHGYLADGVCCLAVYAKDGDPENDRAALAHVDHTLERVHGLRGWDELRLRSVWVKAHFNARLGDLRRAREQLESAYRRLFKASSARQAVAAAIDLAQLRCRHSEPREDNLKAARRVLAHCLGHPRLTAAHEEGLREMIRVLKKYPERAFDRLVDFRRSFIALVPGLLGERMGER